MPTEARRAGSAQDIRLEAALWLVELQAGGDDAELRVRWQRWYDTSAEHRQAWERIEAFGASLRQLPPTLAHAALAPRASRRRALKALALLLGAGGGAWLVAESRHLPALTADLRTGRGERRQIALEDGSRIDLNVDTALDLRFDGQIRRLVLHQGEIHIVTAPDPQGRPFFVDTPQGRARALGTRYIVRTGADEAETRVAVHAGTVAIEPANGEQAAPVLLPAGQQTRFTTHAVQPATAAREKDAAWTRGILVAEDMPLPAFTAELARLTGRALRCDPALAHLKVSGTYPLADPEAVLDLLAAALPVRLERRKRWWGNVETRLSPA
ncbi:DUF4880 domain-containing protein [Pseudothauera nasutitermitis]|uniref:DUF4880 domain-containing protein n=1 Tax=Pseudothauera nasutitermitis TaxID=2565930 RepID=A0A4S4B178_9RHOO|nr:FecR domain-containing protein [Pseudothauera nasutitermitis]THF66189.1 DUF4880 domain-containing protein [Pseudothauera nasutitermitis]